MASQKTEEVKSEGASGVGARRGNYYYAHGTVATDPNFARPEKITAEEAARRERELNGDGEGSAGKLGPSSWNVKDYHWEEKDKTEWAKERLQELMGAVSAPVGKKGTVRVGEVGVEGFLAVNIRKGKMKTFFEMTIVAWVGQLEDKRFGTTTVRGSMTTRSSRTRMPRECTRHLVRWKRSGCPSCPLALSSRRAKRRTWTGP